METQINQSGTDPGLTATVLGKPNQQQSMENSSIATMKPKQLIRRDVPRYVVLAGDLMPDGTKRNFRTFQGYQVGGQFFDLIDVPCLWKFSGFLTRGRITPLIKRPVMKFQNEIADEIAKHKQADDYAEVIGPNGEIQQQVTPYRTEFPWDSLQTLLAQHNTMMGITEVEALEGIDWDLRVVQTIQDFYFPQWEQILLGKSKMPFKLKDFVAHIEARKSLAAQADAQMDIVESVGDAYLESAEKFGIYAKDAVDKAKELFARGTNDKGFLAPISAYAQHLAAQLGINLERETQIIVPAQQMQPVTSDEDRDLERRKVAAMEEANRIAALQLGGVAAIKDEPKTAQTVSAPAGESMEVDGPETEDVAIEEPEDDADVALDEPQEEVGNMSATGAQEAAKKTKNKK